MTGVKLPHNLSSLSLYPHQKEAVKAIVAYLKSPISRNGKSALVQMPTGSGKTGIIAAVSRLCPGIKRTLILAPRVAIRDLLIREVNKDFFTKANIAHPYRIVSPLTKGLAKKMKTLSDGIVLVATIQQLDFWRRSNAPEYKSLRENLDLVIVDEGHYEPALSWSVSIRDLRKPVALFTATPYRNDLKNFQFDPKAIVTLRFDDAVKDKFIRNVKVVRREKKTTIKGFVEDVWEAFEEHIDTRRHGLSKLIIRCESSQDIEKICNEFKRLEVEAIGIHENFKDKDPRKPWLIRTVPDPKKVTELVWVHQNKLLEGIDSHEFRMAAAYGEIGSVRSLVQQVGRIIRNPGKKSGQKAFLLDHHDGEFERMWNGFLDYDRKTTPEALTRPLSVLIDEAFNKELPDLEYFDKSFRKRFSLDAIVDPRSEFCLPKSTYIFDTDPQTSVKKISSWISDGLNNKDSYYRAFNIQNGGIFAYISIQNSKYLSESYFIEPRLGLIIFKKCGALVSFFDTGGMLPGQENSAGVRGPVSPKKMQRLINKSGRSRILEVSTRNSSVANSTIRARTISSASLEGTAPLFDDFQHFLTSAKGYTQDPTSTSLVRRYLGFSRGHISQDGKMIGLNEYIKWVDDLFSNLNGSAHPSGLFNRYARELSSLPRDLAAKNILIDLSEASEEFFLVSNNESLRSDDVCSDCLETNPVSDKRIFTIKVNGANLSAEVFYDAPRKRYVIASEALDQKYKMESNDGRIEKLTTFLNKRQSFNIIPEAPNVIYGHGFFFNPNIPTGNNFDQNDFPLGSILFPIDALQGIDSEKGTQCQPRGLSWEAGCLFDFIDNCHRRGSPLREHANNPDILVCDDMNKEVCDFILSGRDGDEDRVVMIHGKAQAAAAPRSASKLQEVCAQAIKNVSFLSMFSSVRPPNQPRWDNPWSAAPHTQGQVLKRIRIGRFNKDSVWREIEKRIKKPTTKREVWIVLGNMLSKSQLISDLSQESPQPETLHTINLLKNTMATASSMGATLKVFCMR